MMLEPLLGSSALYRADVSLNASSKFSGGRDIGFTVLGLRDGIRGWGEDFVIRVAGSGFRIGVQGSRFRVSG